MKRTITILMMSFLSIGLIAQVSEDGDTTQAETDTLKVNLGEGTQLVLITKEDEMDISFEDKRDSLERAEDEYDDDFTYWSGLDFGFTTVQVTEGKGDDWFDIKEANSAVFSLNPVETKIPIFKHHLGINTGLGFTWQDYSLPDSITLVQPNDSIVPGAVPNKLSKNKLKTGYVKVPLLLEINTSKVKSKNFHIAAGLIGGWNYRSVLKQKFEVDGDKTKNKTKGDYNINPWSLEATVRVGYGDLNLFATAALTELFEEGKGPEVYPFTVGVSLLAF